MNMKRATTFLGNHNRGFQLGSNSGSIGPIHFNSFDQPEETPTPSSTVPFSRDQEFRDCGVLTKIDETFSRPASRVALVGIGGVGKSQLAIEYSYRVRERSPQTWVFWVYASNPARFEESYRAIADTVNLPHSDKPDDEILQLVYNWLRREANGPWIIILDNADDSNIFFSANRERAKSDTGSSGSQRRSLAMFLPQSQHGSILITSRDKEAALRLTGKDEHIIKVEPMSEMHSLTLLQTKITTGFSQGDALKLLEALDYIPLAISQATAFIKQLYPRFTMSKYLDEFRKSDNSKTNLLKRDTGDLRRDHDVSNSIMVTWQISFDHIRNTQASAAHLLSLMSFFDRQGIEDALVRDRYKDINGETDINIQREVAVDGEIELDFEDDISTLRNYSLITVQGKGGNFFEMHRLVQFSTRKWLEIYGVVEGWKERYIMLLYDKFPKKHNTSWDNWKKCRAMFSHVEAMLAHGPAKDGALAQWTETLRRAVSFANSKEDLRVAQHISEQALEKLEKTMSMDHLETLAIVNDLAATIAYQGQFEAAREFNQRARDGRKKALGKEHPDWLESLQGLALILQCEGKFRAAEKIMRQVLKGYTKTGVGDQAKLKVMNNLGNVLFDQKKYQATANISLEVLRMSMQVEEDITIPINAIGHLVTIFRLQENIEAAEKLGKMAKEKCEERLGPKHPTTLLNTYNYAVLVLWN